MPGSASLLRYSTGSSQWVQTECPIELHLAALRSQATQGPGHRPQEQASPTPGWAAVGCTTCHCASAPNHRGSTGRPQRPPRP
eukprot:14932491-Alexandrium_andersonii.AAC.1